MVLEPARLPDPAPPTGVTVVVLDPDQPDFAVHYAAGAAVSQVGFAASGTATGADGPAQRDAAITAMDPAHLSRVVTHTRAGLWAQAVAFSDTEGVLATGGLQGTADVREVVGVATLPRRAGAASAPRSAPRWPATPWIRRRPRVPRRRQ